MEETLKKKHIADSNPFFDLEVKANEYRKETLEMCIRARTGHVTSSMSCAEILTALYDVLMRHNPKNPSWEDRDRFILSKGQASPILYAVLAHKGYFPKEHLKQFCVGEDGAGKNAPFGVHLQCTVPGVEFTTGSLGHGLGYGAGMAHAAKMRGQNHLVYVLLGDGELYEGSNWEVIPQAAHFELDNLIAIVDRNMQCTNGFTEKDIVRLEPLGEKFLANGWNVKEVNGHSIKEIVEALKLKRSFRNDKPLAVIANTIKGKGIKSLEAVMNYHGKAPEGDEVNAAREDLREYAESHIANGGYNDNRY